MGSNLLCTVIIPTYNRCDLLSLTLETLTRQTVDKESFEILVVDDGSNDGTKAEVERFVSRLKVRHIFKPREGYRLATARNIGFREAQSEICIVVDDGLLLAAGFLEAHIAAHAGHARPQAVIGYTYCFGVFDEKALRGQFDEQDLLDIQNAIDPDDADGTIQRFRQVPQWQDIRDRYVYASLGDSLEEYPAPWAIFFGCNFSAPTSQLRQIGGCDEFFRSFGGCDIDLGYRLHRSGLRFVLDRDAVAIHAPHAPNLLTQQKSLLCSSYYIANKYRTPVTALLPTVSVLGLNQYVLRNRIQPCEEYLQEMGRPSLMGILSSHPDHEHSRLRALITSHHESRGSDSDVLTLLDISVWKQLTQQFNPLYGSRQAD